MAKIYGLFGSMTGKLADTVMAVRNGEQLARKYQPVVYNPQTPAQVANRAKLKLASQMSAVMSPVIAIPRRGSVSARNLFVKKNFGALSYADNTAEVDMSAIKVTDSVVDLPNIQVSRPAGQSFNLLASLESVDDDVDMVVYAAIGVGENGEMRFLGSAIANEAGEGGYWPATINVRNTGKAYVYAYGIRENNDRARTTFGNMTLVSAEDIAELIVTRVLTNADITVTDTRFAAVPAASQS